VGDSQLAQVRSAWSAILTQLAGDSRVAWTAFHAATPVSVSQGVLAVAVAEPGNVRAIAQRGHDERLRQAIIDVVSLDLTIDVLHDPGAAAAASNRAPRPSDRPGGPAPAGTAGRAGEVPAQSPQPAEAPTVPTGSPGQTAAPTAATRGADLIRAAAAGAAAAEEHSDEPSEDDPDLSGADGLALITRELGARPIGEIDHS
jgi:DNA polymerase-3 subunit gamma/tau